MSADLPQYILTGVIVVLTITLIILGIQIFLILRQSQQTLKKVNKILDGATGIVGNSAILNNPLVKVLAGTALAFLAGKKRIEKKEEKEKVERAQIQKPKSPTRRFFRRSL